MGDIVAKEDDKNISVPIPDFVENLVKLTVKECLPKIIEEHRQNCPVNDLKNDIWGNKNPGIKADVRDLKKDMKAVKGVGGWLKDLGRMIIAALIIAFIFWMLSMYKTP